MRALDMKRTVAAIGIAMLTVSGPVAAASADPLRGSEWIARDIGGRSVAENIRSTITFSRAGEAGGSGGCNQYSGPVTIDGRALSFGQLASTMRACPEPLMEQEQRFYAALSATRSWRMDGAALFFESATGEVLVRFEKAGR